MVEHVGRSAEHLEQTLLNVFDEAFDEDDLLRARDVARQLVAWNGGRAVVQRYLAKVDLFFDADSVLADTTGAVTGDKDRTFMHKRLRARHAHIVEACLREKAVIEQVFPFPAHVFEALLERVFAQWYGYLALITYNLDKSHFSWYKSCLILISCCCDISY